VIGFATLAPAWGQVTIPTLPGSTTTTTAPEPPPTTAPEPAPTTTAVESPPVTELAPLPVEPLPLDTVPSVVTPTPNTTRAPAVSRAGTTGRPTALVSAVSPAAVTGAFGIGLAAVTGFALILIVLATRVTQGGSRMSDARRNRLYIGIGLLALAAIVGLVGYLKLSLEPDVNRQIPYLASAGMALVVLSAAGGALIVGEQLRADDRRIEELETAVMTLSGALAGSIEAPARRGAPVVLEAADADREERAEAEATKVVTHSRARGRSAKKR
jgi:hypothetical protein